MQRADRLRGTWRDPHQGEVNFAEYMSDWFGSRQIAESTAAGYAASIESWILPRLTGSNRASVELGTLNRNQLTPAVIRRRYALMSENARASALKRLTYIPGGYQARIWARGNANDYRGAAPTAEFGARHVAAGRVRISR